MVGGRRSDCRAICDRREIRSPENLFARIESTEDFDELSIKVSDANVAPYSPPLFLHEDELPSGFIIDLIIDGLSLVMKNHVFQFGDSWWLRYEHITVPILVQNVNRCEVGKPQLVAGDRPTEGGRNILDEWLVL